MSAMSATDTHGPQVLRVFRQGSCEALERGVPYPEGLCPEAKTAIQTETFSKTKGFSDLGHILLIRAWGLFPPNLSCHLTVLFQSRAEDSV